MTPSARPVVEVVGLGPGDPGLVTSATHALVAEIPVRFVRTSRHPSAHLAGQCEFFDDLYETLPTFDEVYDEIARRVGEAARAHGRVLYAVPGSPTVLERSVSRLRASDDLDVIVHPAVSFLDEVWRALRIDPVDEGVRLVDGHRFAVAAAGWTGPMLVAHTHANWVLSDIKLAVDDPPDNVEVTLLHHLGLADERIVSVPWADIDRTLDADHLTSLWIPGLAVPVAAELAKFHELARTLRRQCPWDMEQTHTSLVKYLLEETYELVDAIARLDPEDPSTEDDFIEELGDLLYQVEFHAAIAEQEGRFTISDVARGVHDKLVARHPHVFGDVTVSGSGEVEANWEAIKAAEKPQRTGIFDGLAVSSPSLLLAHKVQQRAARVGFDWPDAAGPLAKVAEEAAEVERAAASGDPEAVMAEVGDLLFAVVNVARKHDIDAESALRGAVGKFRERVEAVESLAVARGRQMSEMSLDDLDQLWEEVKRTAAAHRKW